MKYSLPHYLLSGNVHIYIFFKNRFFLIPVTGSDRQTDRRRERENEGSAGNDSLSAASDEAWRGKSAKIRGADHQHQGLFLI